MIIEVLEIILIMLLFILSRGNLSIGTEGRRNFYIVAWIFLMLIYLLKDNLNLPDMATYEIAYKYPEYGDFEQGYVTFTNLLNNISHNFWTFIVFYAFFITTTNIYFQNKYAVMPFFCLLLYVCDSFYSLFLVRQYIAMNICILTIPFIINKKILPFLLLSLIATTFHRTAYVWIFVYCINYLKINYKYLGLICIGSIAFVKGIDLLLGDFALYISRIESYITQEATQYTWKTLVVSLAVLGYVVLSYGRNIKKIEGFEKICFFMMIFSTLLDMINVIGTSFSAIYRIKPYCGIFIPFMIPYATLQIKKPKIKFFAVIVISCLYIWLLIAGINQQRGWFGFIF